MEVAIIDWKTINSSFVKDDLYENINAPRWVDFEAPQESVDDEAWFCRPDCNHPKTVEDFHKELPNSKRPATVSEILPLSDPNTRDAALKKRGFTQTSFSSKKDSRHDTVLEDSENQNPNFSTPPNRKANKFIKEAFDSSIEKRGVDDSLHKEEAPRLKSTLSARNLFAGRDILNQITEFCNELKRLATRGKDRGNVKSPEIMQKHKAKDQLGERLRDLNEREERKPLLVVRKEKCGAMENSNVKEKQKQEVKDRLGENLSDLDNREERKPLLEASKEKCETVEKSNAKQKLRRKKRDDEAENTPIYVDLKNIKGKGHASLSQIRTCPPSPQCFSAIRDPAKATPPKAFRSRPPQEGGILQEVDQSKGIREKLGDEDNHGRSIEKEEKTFDVFWFLKPCTLSS
ncbi:unnamed protein product [Ilex paraguariensis]|uniref:Uncharacterized protein n=1 Tax=Ilex paraguariensis TaxID=185542 RepID=A0ABC8T5K3_9AQUA